MTLYAAIDLHSSNSVLAVLDENDRPLRQRRLPNELPVILRELEPFHEELAGIVVESTCNWYWLVDGLKAHGYSVHLANTAAVSQYAGLRERGQSALSHARRSRFLTGGRSRMRMYRSIESPMIHTWHACPDPISPTFRSTSCSAETTACPASSMMTTDDATWPSCAKRACATTARFMPMFS